MGVVIQRRLVSDVVGELLEQPSDSPHQTTSSYGTPQQLITTDHFAGQPQRTVTVVCHKRADLPTAVGRLRRPRAQAACVGTDTFIGTAALPE
ncbi:hypothetical protein P8A22_07540 [Streptomyces laculatispora]|uniref:Uncharacterized protein n=1 Tax=Streptomyces laculatispora TaxID=887464 RepID=A0ABY9HZ60_9ACTN|nr:hypothetical protein [Streptomyces laculatispora]WLQ39878.1 hypothetical protein P8A22_07540 [Streptomyces laculatispora]